MVPGSCQRRDDYYQNHPIPTHLIGSVKASYEPACCCTRLGVGSPLPLLSRKQNCVITLVVPRLRRTWFRGESGRARCATAQSTDGGRSTPVMPPPSVRTRNRTVPHAPVGLGMSARICRPPNGDSSRRLELQDVR